LQNHICSQLVAALSAFSFYQIKTCYYNKGSVTMFVAMNKAHFCHTDCITADKGFLDIANI